MVQLLCVEIEFPPHEPGAKRTTPLISINGPTYPVWAIMAIHVAFPSPGENTMPVTLMAMLRFKAQEIFTVLEKASTQY